MRPRCVTLILTERCPLACRHCGTDSGPGRRGDMPAAAALAAVAAAARAGCPVLNLSGGEPMLRPELVTRVTAAAHGGGMIVRLTTSAAWAADPATARRRLAPLARAGLSQVFLSAGAFHDAQRPPERLLAAATAARDLGLRLYLALCGADADHQVDRLLRSFRAAGLAAPPYYHQPLAAVGRGRGLDIPPAGTGPARPGGDTVSGGGNSSLLTAPCPSLGRHPTLWPDGLWTGCAGVGARQAPDLACGRNGADGVAGARERLGQDPLWTWLAALGPAALAALVGRQGGGSGPCADCLAVLADPAARRSARRRLPGPGTPRRPRP